MSRTLRIWLALAVVIGAAVLSFQGKSGSRSILAADSQLRWWKGNLHTHSMWSDGDDYPEMIALWYRRHDYHFIVYTDHNVLPTIERWTDVGLNKGGDTAYGKLRKEFPDWIDERNKDERHEVRLRRFDEVSEKLSQPGQFLLIQGEEISDRFGILPVHLNATNLRDVVPPMGGESVTEVIQRNVDAVNAQRERTGQPMIVHLNHPNFGFGVTPEDIVPVRGEKFFEVYNGHPAVVNAGFGFVVSTDRLWDIVLTRRLAELKLPVLYGLANDDGHNYHHIPSRASEPGRGWVMVLASELNPASIIEALEAGRFYASSGVTLSRVVSSPEGLDIEVQADPGVEYRIDFIGTHKDYDPATKPVLGKDGKQIRNIRWYSSEIGKTFVQVPGPSASYRFRGDELYVRARVTSTRRHPNPSMPGEFERAWCQPVLGPGLPKE